MREKDLLHIVGEDNGSISRAELQHFLGSYPDELPTSSGTDDNDIMKAFVVGQQEFEAECPELLASQRWGGERCRFLESCLSLEAQLTATIVQ